MSASSRSNDRDGDGDTGPSNLRYTGDTESMRMVCILSCEPGVTQPHEQPITIIHLGHEGQVHQPVALDMAESRRLLRGLLISLATLAKGSGHGAGLGC